MEDALRKLTERLPPPDAVGGRDENWRKVESEINLLFPSHFKELLSVYGDSVWFDLYHILYPDTLGPTEAYLKAVQEQLDILVEHGMTDGTGQEISMPLYPDPGGLFPFMASSDGDYYFWRTDSPDPDQWPMLIWQMDTLSTMKFHTLAELFLDTLGWMQQNQPHRVWVRPRLEP